MIVVNGLYVPGGTMEIIIIILIVIILIIIIISLEKNQAQWRT